MCSEHTLSFQLHRRIYENSKLPTFCDITQVWQCVKIVFIWSDDFTYRAPYPDDEIFSYP